MVGTGAGACGPSETSRSSHLVQFEGRASKVDMTEPTQLRQLVKLGTVEVGTRQIETQQPGASSDVTEHRVTDVAVLHGAGGEVETFGEGCEFSVIEVTITESELDQRRESSDVTDQVRIGLIENDTTDPRQRFGDGFGDAARDGFGKPARKVATAT